MLLVIAVQLAAARTAHAADKGIVDHRLEYEGGIDLGPVPAYAEAMGPSGLDARWTRVFVYWDQLEPKAPWDDGYEGYDPAYLHELDTVVQALRGQGLKVILTAGDPPVWASDAKYKKYWAKNQKTSVVRMRDKRVTTAFRAFAGFLTARYAAFGVKHFEVWNEPNLRLIPQIVGKKKRKKIVGPEVYRQMLVAFSKGARAASKNVVVIAGATSRFGSPGTSTSSTSPQWFAKYLKSKRARKWFDAYSHHPYSTRQSAPQPSAKPRRPDISVTLGNLSVLLKIFPRTDFYLTEYCYSTSKYDAFVLAVSKPNQARYLRQAYALLAKPAYRRVKALLWFLVRDWQSRPGDPTSVGVYTGLVDSSGERKPSWWAFIGGNSLSIAAAPSPVVAGATFDITGVLTARRGPEPGATVRLQRRSLTGKKWRTVSGAWATTDETGAYTISGVTQTSAKRYRVVWDGVVESRRITVKLAK